MLERTKRFLSPIIIGSFPLYVNLTRRKRVTIVVHHNPLPEDFEQIIAFYKKYFNIIPLSLMAKCVRERDASQLPEFPLIITLDDGRLDNAKLLPILEKHNITITIFLTAGIINTHRIFWEDVDPELDRIPLKKIPNNERESLLKQKYGFFKEKEYPRRVVLSLDEIRRMSSQVEWGAHSMFHPVLTSLTHKEAEFEIKGSKDKLEELLNQPVNFFAYPYGNYGEREINLCREAGYELARSIDVGLNGINTNPYALKATGGYDYGPLESMCLCLTGLSSRILFYRTSKSLKGRYPSYRIRKEA